MKNIKTVIALLFISSVFISLNAHATGGKPSDDPTVTTVNSPSSPETTTIWTQIMTSFGL